MSDGKFELFLTGGIGSLAGYLMSALTFAFKAGRRDAELATKKELQDYIKRHEFQALKDDVKSDLTEIKATQEKSDARAETRHAQLIEALLRGRDT